MRKFLKQQILLCEVVIKYAQEEMDFVSTIRENGIFNQVAALQTLA